MNDIEQILRYTFKPGEVFGLVALGFRDNEKKKINSTGFFDSVDRALEELEKPENCKYANYYFNLNPVIRDMLSVANNRFKENIKSASASVVIEQRYILIDCDPNRKGGITASANKKEKKYTEKKLYSIREYLLNLGFPDFFLADSGNGFHGRLLFSPTSMINDRPMIKQFLLALQNRFQDKHVTIDVSMDDPNQLCKLYGTIARKGDHTDDRPHRLSKIIQMPEPEPIVDRDLILKVIEENPRPDIEVRSGGKKSFKVKMNYDPEVLLADKILRKEEKDGKTLLYLECPWISNHSTKDAPKDAVLFVNQDGSVGFKCVHAGCSGKKYRDVLDKLGYDGKTAWKEEQRRVLAYTKKFTEESIQKNDVKDRLEDLNELLGIKITKIMVIRDTESYKIMAGPRFVTGGIEILFNLESFKAKLAHLFGHVTDINKGAWNDIRNLIFSVRVEEETPQELSDIGVVKSKIKEYIDKSQVSEITENFDKDTLTECLSEKPPAPVRWNNGIWFSVEGLKKFWSSVSRDAVPKNIGLLFNQLEIIKPFPVKYYNYDGKRTSARMYKLPEDLEKEFFAEEET